MYIHICQVLREYSNTVRLVHCNQTFAFEESQYLVLGFIYSIALVYFRLVLVYLSIVNCRSHICNHGKRAQRKSE